MKVAIVTWLDAHYTADEVTVHAAQDMTPVPTESVGFVMANTPSGITLGTDAFPDHPGHYKHVHFVPNDMVISVKYLEPVPDPMTVELVDDD